MDDYDKALIVLGGGIAPKRCATIGCEHWARGCWRWNGNGRYPSLDPGKYCACCVGPGNVDVFNCEGEIVNA